MFFSFSLVPREKEKIEGTGTCCRQGESEEKKEKESNLCHFPFFLVFFSMSIKESNDLTAGDFLVSSLIMQTFALQLTLTFDHPESLNCGQELKSNDKGELYYVETEAVMQRTNPPRTWTLCYVSGPALEPVMYSTLGYRFDEGTRYSIVPKVKTTSLDSDSQMMGKAGRTGTGKGEGKGK